MDSIPLGIDFRQHLEGTLSQCRVLIAVIGDQWIERGSAVGKRRIDDSRDQLRVELEVALGRNIPVIPVLVRKASVPTEEELPPSLKSLATATVFKSGPIQILAATWTGLSKESSRT